MASPRVLAALTAAAGLASSAATNVTSFLVMGDWGGDEHAPYCTDSEKDTASAMNSAAELLGSKFAVVLGDNMYHSGVTSVNDTRFQSTFEDVFTGAALSSERGFKFHLVAGNHDHVGNVQAQIQYSSVSPRWVFPSLYYTFSQMSQDGATVQFVMIDTIVLAGQSQIEGTIDQLPGHSLTGPDDLAAADAQLEWIEQTLAASKAEYLIVAGHYPVFSVCNHGPTLGLHDTLKPLLLKHKVSAYWAGHDHCSEHIDVGDGLQYHGIGAAAYHDKSFPHIHTVTPSQLKYLDAEEGGGFASVTVSKAALSITHHDANGKKQYTSTLGPRSVSAEVVV